METALIFSFIVLAAVVLARKAWLALQNRNHTGCGSCSEGSDCADLCAEVQKKDRVDQ